MGKRSKRSKDFSSKKDEVPFVKLDYKWTLGCAKEKVADTTVYESPELHLPGATFNFIFEVDNDDGSENDRKNRLFVVNNSESSVHFSGIAAYDQNRLEVQKEVHPGIIGLLDFDGRVDAPEFRFDLKVYGLGVDESINKYVEEKKEKRHRKLTKNLLQNVKNMLFDCESSDVHINVEDKTIKAHKFVLVARSPVFASMFKTPGVNSELTRIHITDFSHATVERLVGFLYGDFPDVHSIASVDLIRELYLASDLYRVLELREACGRELVKRVTTDNVWPLVDLFYCRGDAQMTKRIADVCRRHVNVVVNTEGWKYVKARYPDFSGMVLESLAKVEK